MTDDEFKALAIDIGKRLRGTGDRWIFVVASPAALRGQDGPQSTGNCSAAAQAAILHAVADSLENGATEEYRIDLAEGT